MKAIKTILAVCLMTVATAANAQKTYVHITYNGTQYEFASDGITSMTMDTKARIGTGIAKAKLNGTDEVDVTWVQLWAGGPKWATINIGVTSTSATGTDLYGGHYCWGKTKDNGDKNEYCSSTTDISGTDDDTAKNIWGSNWRMPTSQDFTDLLDSQYCESQIVYASYEQPAGVKFTGKGDYSSNSVFFPKAGYSYDGISHNDSQANYWSSTPYDDYAYYLYFESIGRVYGGDRNHGYSVRAVLAE